MGFLGFLAGPIGWLMSAIYDLVSNYFVTILLVTLIVRILTFPFALKSQKNTADRARLAPRLERIQKKYGQDRQKMALKQQELYQKEGVSMTGGCLPSLFQMIVLFSMLAVIYNPLQHLTSIPDTVITSSVEAVTKENYEGAENKLGKSELQGYYRELNLLKVADKNEKDILDKIVADGKGEITAAQAREYYNTMLKIGKEFSIGGYSLLDNPWGGGFAAISLLWLIPILSGLSAFAMSFLSTRYMKASMGDQQMPGAGCSNGMMLYLMPIFSFVITFSVPGGVGIYWIFSNLIGLGQTVLLNKIYNPAKIRAQAEIEYEQKRRQRAEDKKRLAEQRAREQAELDRARKAEENGGKKKATQKKKTEPVQQPEEEQPLLNGEPMESQDPPAAE